MQRTKAKIQLKGPEDGTRRYPKSEANAYHQVYSKKASESWILNESIRRRNTGTAMRLSGLGECKSTLVTIKGNPNKGGRYFETKQGERRSRLASLPAAKKQLVRVYKKYKLWQKKQVKNGRSLEEPDYWPDGLRTECLKAQALFDVRKKEKHFVELKIEEYKAKRGKEEQKTEPILPWGPVGNFAIQEWLREGSNKTGGQNSNQRVDRIVGVDGQKVSYTARGIPFIDEPDSPYHEMPIATYRQMSKRWMKEHRIRDMDLVKRKNAFKKKAEEKGIKLPAMFTRRNFEKLIKGEVTYKNQSEFPEFKPWPDNPEWPEGAQKITEIEQDI